MKIYRYIDIDTGCFKKKIMEICNKVRISTHSYLVKISDKFLKKNQNFKICNRF